MMYQSRIVTYALAVAAAVVAISCESERTPPSPVSPTAVSDGATATTSSDDTVEATATDEGTSTVLPPVAYPSEGGFGNQVINFPPRNEPFAFRQFLEGYYRDTLRRGATTSFVDIEGTIVWTQEYLRYRVNACDHLQAQARVFLQIDGAGIQPVCGAEQTTPTFPPRNEPFVFRQALEAKYRDQLRRNAVATFVDVEGDIVWTQEYLRYRVLECDHASAQQFVVDQIQGRGIAPGCGRINVPFRRIAVGNYDRFDQRGTQVVRNLTSWNQLANEIQRFGYIMILGSVDFTREMAVVVKHGFHAGAGDCAEFRVEKVTQRATFLEVASAKVSPHPSCGVICAAAISYPFDVIAVGRSNDDVRGVWQDRTGEPCQRSLGAGGINSRFSRRLP